MGTIYTKIKEKAIPTYEYECDNCGHNFDIHQGFHDPVKKKCPECKKHKLRRVIHVPHVHVVNETLGTLADKNSARFSEDYKHHLEEKHKTKKIGPPSKLPEGMKRVDTTQPDPEAQRKFKKINKMTVEQKKKYVETGEGL